MHLVNPRSDGKYRPCKYLPCPPWKKLPLGVAGAALDRASHTTVSAPWATVRKRSPIIWRNRGIAAEMAGTGVKAVRRKQEASVSLCVCVCVCVCVYQGH